MEALRIGAISAIAPKQRVSPFVLIYGDGDPYFSIWRGQPYTFAMLGVRT